MAERAVPLERQASSAPARQGRGAPIEEQARKPLEARFGFDFSHVRIHADRPLGHDARPLGHDPRTLGHDPRTLGHDTRTPEARTLGHDSRTPEARTLGHDPRTLGHDSRTPEDHTLAHDARAVTVGSDIYLADPALARNRALLVHELAHVVAQRPGADAHAANAERDADAAVGAWAKGDKIPPIGRSAVTTMFAGVGELRVAEARQRDETQQKLRLLAGSLLRSQLKADVLKPTTAGDDNLNSQQQILEEHIDRVAGWLRTQLAASLPDPEMIRAIEVGVDAAGVAADLMYYDRVGMQSKARVRKGVNRGFAWVWKAMKLLKADPMWAETNRAEADEAIQMAVFHRDTVEDFIKTSQVMKAGVTAASVANMVVTAPQLLKSGSQLLKGLWEWLNTGGGGAGTLMVTTTGLTMVSGGRTLVLTAEQVEALVQAGLLSSQAHGLYMMSSGSKVGPFGERPAGSKSRFDDREIAKEYLKEIGRKVPAGERALEELGVTARGLRKMEEHHHLLVQQLRKWFKERGVNIDDFTVKLSADEHRWIHNEYKWNELWKAFRLKNPNASPEEIMTAMREFQRKVGLEGLEIIPYPK